MRAVNLVPSDEARATGAGRSGGAAHLVLGVLALAVVMVGAWAYLGQAVGEREADAARIHAEADSAEAKAATLKRFTEFSALSQKRTETVRQLAGSRFDWPHALRDVARTVPDKVWVTSLRATVTSSVSIDGTPDPLRQALAVPAIEVAGCATTQAQVAGTVAAMRQIDDVQRVSLSSSSIDATGGNSAGSCNGPKFSMSVFFNAPKAATPTAAPPAVATTGGTTP